MATNKRKEAAALFELIDKSSLKVPKNAGALKIPAWWSSKTNPPTPTTTSKSPLNGQNAAPGTARPMPQPKNTTLAASSPKARLYDPPPADAPPPSSPSFRPPVSSIPVPVSPSVKAPAPRPTSTETIEPAPKTTIPIAEEADLPEVTLPVPPRPFAPQTFDRGRPLWTPPHAGAFARLPGSVVLSGVVGIIVVICLLIYIFHKTPATTASPGTTGAASQTPNGGTPGTGFDPNATGAPMQRPLIPSMNNATGNVPPNPQGSNAPRGSTPAIARNPQNTPPLQNPTPATRAKLA